MARKYDELKEFNGKRYTGMAVGRSHKWRYDAGEWREKKVTPDRWEFQYAVVKRRAGKAPEGSGAPVGTAYHWYIVADQTVTKLDANSYMTEMTGHKLKLGHRRADKTTWNASDRAQRKQLVKLLHQLINDLETAPSESDRPEPPPPDEEPVLRAATNGHTHRKTARPRTTHASTRRRQQRSRPAPARTRTHGGRASVRR
ncbi:MAG TPA: hypothetical protein VL326_35405 [Kofleriaceae bacterium]|jgi:hypothetical protein|nr:hypothetical protein [Kofleriaceae bacterium]